ncbi:RNA-binding S4 domain-containing protein [Listeria monocytogenes]|nr:RNA-binding S4 domain-containing protein [Listeria monocytogenes]EEO3367868.1 RNA-binding S4 domain-containing protein [Listeria monocytogenes]EEO4427458.1 RNA-binding S4 domain-containing protein [Listeria monocytogenes]EEO4470714.1 RNA-binding S4 domain-containing protein [Listeria monocytogenes]EEO6535567.1 RNA-binding S4 domain-containing protein [Listeria monocytogenes]
MATTMRLDKYLKVSRLIKRRTVAKEVAEKGRIAVNGVTAKPGTNVKSGDELVIRVGPKIVTAKIERLEENAKKEQATEMYTIIKEERTDESR